MGGHGLRELGRVADRPAEGTGHHHALAGARVLDDVVTGDAAEFQGEAFTNHPGDAAHEGGVGLGEVEGANDAVRPQARGETRPDAPDILAVDAPQELLAPGVVVGDDEDAAGSAVGLRPLVGEFAEDLRGAHAERDGDAGGAEHGLLDAQA